MEVCRPYILQQLRSSDFVEILTLSHLYEDKEMKDATLSAMGAEPGNLSGLENWALLEKHPALSLEIADRVRKNLF